MLLYEAYWVRYFKSEKSMADFYAPLWGIPVPGAVLPVAAALSLSIYGRNIFLFGAALCLGIGHIGIHMAHWKEVKTEHDLFG